MHYMYFSRFTTVIEVQVHRRIKIKSRDDRCGGLKHQIVAVWEEARWWQSGSGGREVQLTNN